MLSCAMVFMAGYYKGRVDKATDTVQIELQSDVILYRLLLAEDVPELTQGLKTSIKGNVAMYNSLKSMPFTYQIDDPHFYDSLKFAHKIALGKDREEAR
jgi:hypothetical protein